MSKLDAHILVVDDDLDVLHTARFILKSRFRKITVESNHQQLRYLMKNERFDVVILDMNYTTGATSGKEGLSWLKEIKAIRSDQQVVMMTAYGDIKLAVEAMKFGASDFIVKPWENEKFLATIQAAFDHSQSKRELQELKDKQANINQLLTTNEPEVIGNSSAIKDVLEIVGKVSKTDANVLILGENGTGKEVIAKEIHAQSNHRDQPFVKVDLGAISENLFESELFGHKKGAFTDAKEDRAGRLVIAGDGTLFLDEIGNLSMSLQAKLLSVLQNRELVPVGGSKPVKINARIIAATNCDLQEMVIEKRFREDLLYRLNTVEINIPALRDRKEDLGLLTQYFLEQFNKKYRKDISVDEYLIDHLSSYDWPGNVRELMHVVERAIILADGSTLDKSSFPFKPEASKSYTQKTLNLTENEKEMIEAAIAKHHGNISKAAKELGLGRTTIYRKMDKYGIQY